MSIDKKQTIHSPLPTHLVICWRKCELVKDTSGKNVNGLYFNAKILPDGSLRSLMSIFSIII